MHCNFRQFLPFFRSHYEFVIAINLLAMLLGGCASPSAQFDRYARQQELDKAIVQGLHFDHAVYERREEVARFRQLHIYIGGDGTPWDGNRPAEDPTPRNPLALRLMLADTEQSIYLGRPCYHDVTGNSACTSRLWTSARYSESVIASMAAAIEKLSEQRRVESVVLIGYSGGGVVASLLATRLSNVSVLITIAANLDIDAWTTARNFEPLQGSLNPARHDSVDERIRQIHLHGSLDIKVPPDTTLAYLATNKFAESVEYPEFTHVCCWESIWSDALSELLDQPTN